ncbi:putative Multiple ankyrin repeats single kh domain protein [Fasciola gigantica]|uniref:Putative Multiple ankyrin repeats single kh domain protein n=1 Tax=Fasciola gigantica TaxID=46835 RepID=A0A504YK21_FASGI|nr:putative Multiple ankyrin repeats single kh domain protein [Fasciola gigantica]
MSEKPASIIALLATPVSNNLCEAREEMGHMNVLALLLNAGAQINRINRNGETALARATRRGWVHCAHLLLTYGANPNPMPTDGHSIVVSPLHLARQMHQPAIEQDILSRATSMENQMLEIVRATLPKHVCLLEPGHVVDTRTSSFFPLQLISEEELQRFVLYFKTPPGFDRMDGDGTGRRNGRGLSDELILVYLIRAHLSDGQPRHWLTGPGFSRVSLTFNGTKRNCTRLPIAPDYPGLCVFSVSTVIKTGGLNTLSLEKPVPKHGSIRQPHSSIPARQDFLISLIGAYRVRIDVTSLVQASAGLGLSSSSKATIYIPRSMN